ncbi:MAG: MFS transporter, partial [Anaerolineae bacterium]|nr:MFS transporter [Anaerolineae bacterium]
VSFGLITVISVAVFIISFRLKPIPRTPGIRIDLVGVVLSALAIACILFGFNNLNTWGLVLAKAAAPISLFGLSP